MKQKILFLFLLVYVHFSFAQDEQKTNKFLLNIDYGVASVTSNLKSNWAIRQNVESYDYSGSNNLNSNTWLMYFSAKPEYRFANNRLSISTGVRYLFTISNLEKDDSYFYLRYNQEGANTEFARVKKIRENTNYLGIPVELKYTFAQIQGSGLYLKVGTEFNFKVNSNIDIDFVNQYMNEQKQEVLRNIDAETNSFYSTLYYSVGLKIGHEGKTSVNAEIILPSLFLTSNNFAIVDPKNYWGAQISVEIPF